MEEFISVDERIRETKRKLEWNIKYHEKKCNAFKLALETLNTNPLTEATLSLIEMVVKS